MCVDFVARQLDVSRDHLDHYEWSGRTWKRHRARIRQHFGFRPFRIRDRSALEAWLNSTTLADHQSPAAVEESVLDWCLRQRIEPPFPRPTQRLVRAFLRRREAQVFETIRKRLTTENQARLDGLLESSSAEEESMEADEDRLVTTTTFGELKAEPGRVGV